MTHFSAATSGGKYSVTRGLCPDRTLQLGCQKSSALLRHNSQIRATRKNEHAGCDGADAQVYCQIWGLKCCHLKRAEISPSIPDRITAFSCCICCVALCLTKRLQLSQMRPGKTFAPNQQRIAHSGVVPSGELLLTHDPSRSRFRFIFNETVCQLGTGHDS